MAFPTLNEMLMAVDRSQQVPFIDSYNQAKKLRMEELKQQQEMNRIMQQMQLERDMHPYEMRSKAASAEYNEALSAESMDRLDQSRARQRSPFYDKSIDADLQMPIEKLTEQQTKNLSDSSKYNMDVELHNAIRAFLEDPNFKTAAATSPELMLRLKEMQDRLSMSRDTNATTKRVNTNQWQLLEDTVRRRGALMGWTPQQIEEELYKVLTTQQTTSQSPFPELPPSVRTNIKGGGGQSTDTGEIIKLD